MSRPFSDVVAEIVSTGLTQHQLTLLLELVSVMSTPLSGGSRVESPDSASHKRREWDRKYRQNRRLREKLASTRQSTRQVDTSCNLSSLSESVIEERGTREERTTALIVEGQSKPKRSVSRGTRLSADTQIAPDDLQFAIAGGMTRERALQAWAEFIDYWIGVPGQRGTKLNWSATWRNRVRAIAGNSNGHRGPRALQDDRLSVSKAADRLIEQAERGQFSFGPKPSLMPPSSEDDRRLLPKG